MSKKIACHEVNGFAELLKPFERKEIQAKTPADKRFQPLRKKRHPTA